MPRGVYLHKSQSGFQKAHKINVGRPTSEETKRKISKANSGKKYPTEQYEKRRIAIKARIGVKRKDVIWNKGKKLSLETRKKMSLSQKGREMSLETRKKLSDAHKGEKNRFWKGGLTKINRAIRNSFEYRIWRESVFKRDNWTCVWCLRRGGSLNADHIKRFSEYPELRFAIDNGRTLCVPCHRKTDTYGRGVV